MTTRTWLLACAGCLVLGAVADRYFSRTPDSSAHEAARETIAESATQEAARVEEAHHEAQEATERIVYRDRVVYRDGPVAEVTREVEGTRSQVATVADTRAAEVRVEVREVEVVREVERRIEVRTPLPDWRVGGLVGLSLRGGPEPAYGVELQRRLWGPVYLQAWGLNAGAAGVGVGVEF